MDVLGMALVVSTLLCCLVAGIVLTFACVAMPGIGRLNDRDFLQAFKAMDRVIQDNQPVFMLVWVGSVVALIATTVLGVMRLDGLGRILIVSATALYLVAVQLPTATVNIPLNNRLQSRELDTLSAAALHEARTDFEPRWVRWNLIRTIVAVLVSTLLILAVLGVGVVPP